MYQEPSFTSLYTQWDFFCSKQQKIKLVHHALVICSVPKLDAEIELIRKVQQEWIPFGYCEIQYLGENVTIVFPEMFHVFVCTVD